ncbi:MAG: GNAT family N-acetyltransferase [Candidatus Eisenbacteria bacterium]
MSAIRIAPATPGDVPLVLEFIRGLAVYEKLEHEVVVTAAGLEDALFGRRPVAEALIAHLDDAPVGFAFTFETFSTFVGTRGTWLEDLFVVPEARGRGVGRALLAALAARCVERGQARLEWAVLDWNEPAIRFYGSMGAAPMDEWTTHRVSGEALTQLAKA